MKNTQDEPKKVRTREELEKEQDSKFNKQSEQDIQKTKQMQNTNNTENKKDSKEHKKEAKKKAVTSIAKAYLGDEKGAIKDAEAAKKELDQAKKKDDEDGNKEKKPDIKRQIKRTFQLMKMLQSLYKLLMAIKLMIWLKNLAAMIAAAIAKAVNALIGWFINLGKMIAGAFTKAACGIKSATSSVASFFGTTPSVVGGFFAGITTTVTVTTTAVVISTTTVSNIAERDATVNIDCAADSILAASGAAIDAENASNEKIAGNELKNANTIYSIFKAAGYSDTNIAGILGCWKHESSMDPTAFINIYDEPYRIGPKKQAVIDGGYYNTAIGLAQWRGNRKLGLIEFGKKHNEKGIWYEVETEVQFALTADGDDTKLLKSWKEEATPESAAIWFCNTWERAGKNFDTSSREKSAADYYSKMQNSKIVADTTYGQGILDAVKFSAATAQDTAVAEKTESCNDLTKLASNADNSNIASAAVSLCYPYSKLHSVRDRVDPGTELYQDVNNKILGSSAGGAPARFRDCGKFVGTVVHWCGADKNFPKCGSSQQQNYLFSSSKWQEIDWGGDYKKLSPGDVLVLANGKTHHICIYVGYDAIATVYSETPKNEDIVICSASMDGKSAGYPPCCRNFYSNLSNFYAFRCIKPDNDTTYKDIGKSVAIDQKINSTPTPKAGAAPGVTTKPKKKQEKKKK